MMPIEIFKALLLGFTVGLTGALVPGPMLFATIEASLKKGWLAGPKLVFGHMLIEFALCILIFLGAASFIGEKTISVVSLLGGLALVVFGLLTLKDAKKAAFSNSRTPNNNGMNLISSPTAAGIITSVSNPYFWIWWLTAGSALVLREYELGIVIAISYVIGHWAADFGWYTAISGSFSKGKALLSPKAHKIILYACGAFLVVFGTWFVANYNIIQS
jgi:threonine/homoserine/homoserine lactone efflux protein